MPSNSKLKKAFTRSAPWLSCTQFPLAPGPQYSEVTIYLPTSCPPLGGRPQLIRCCRLKARFLVLVVIFLLLFITANESQAPKSGLCFLIDVAKQRAFFACLHFKAPFDSFIRSVPQHLILKDFVLKINSHRAQLTFAHSLSLWEIDAGPVLIAALQLRSVLESVGAGSVALCGEPV